MRIGDTPPPVPPLNITPGQASWSEDDRALLRAIYNELNETLHAVPPPNLENLTKIFNSDFNEIRNTLLNKLPQDVQNQLNALMTNDENLLQDMHKNPSHISDEPKLFESLNSLRDIIQDYI